MEIYGINITSGNTDIIDLPNSNIQIESHSGNVRCGTMNNVEIKTTSGGIKLGNANKANLTASSRKYYSRRYKRGRNKNNIWWNKSAKN